MSLSFGQRLGLKPVREVIQTHDMDIALRNALWNVLDFSLWSREGFVYESRNNTSEKIRRFCRAMWLGLYNEPVDELPPYGKNLVHTLRERFFSCQWFEVYEFFEFTLNYMKEPKLIGRTNEVLERELSGFRFVNGLFTPITDAQEISMLEDALTNTDFPGVQAHLQRALELYSDRTNPDYRNSIKESISAVETIVRILTDSPKATLGEALKRIENTHKIHSAVKDGFIKLYGFTSDEGGIRHSMLEEPKLDAGDARYFLVSCSAFINYLKAKSN